MRRFLLIGLLVGLGQWALPAQAMAASQLDSTAAWSSADVDNTWSVAWGDVDNDGDLDLAAANQGSPNKVYLNMGGALQTTAGWTSADNNNTRTLAWGDVDNDGDLDLAVGNFGAANKIYLNDEGALQPTAAWLSNDNDNTRDVAWGDVDGDGDLDLAAGNFGAANKIYLNENGRLQTTAAWVSTESDRTRSIAWGDVDNDGDLDLAVGNANDPNKLYLNNNGSLSETADWRSDISQDTASVAWGDVNNDGYPELAVGNLEMTNQVYGNINGTLQTTPDYWGSGDQDYTWSVAWGDADGDGDLDLAAGNAGPPFEGNNKVYLSEGGILQTAADNPWTSTEQDRTHSVAWGDVDGDGDLDLAAGNERDPNRLYLNDGRGLQTNADNPWVSGDRDQTYSVVWGDVDSDGDLDLAAGNFAEPNKLYLNQNGVLQTNADNPWTSSDSDQTTSVAWGDVDGDSDLDLAAGNIDSPNKLYFNENGVLQTTAAWTAAGSNTTTSLAWGDVDGDGDLDLAVGNRDVPNQLYLNDAGSLRTTADWSSADSNRTTGVAWGDVDLDGDLDLAVANFNVPNKLYLNENGVLRKTAIWASTDSDNSSSLAWGDVEGDGDLDLAVGNANGPNKLYRNEGGALTTTPAWTSEDGEATFSVAWGDVDGDGDLDLAAGNKNDVNKVYFNQSGVLQTAAANPWLSGDFNETRSVAWGDVDGDGDLDLAVGNTSDSLPLRENKLYLNQARQSNSPFNEPAYAAIEPPGTTDAAFFFSTPEIQPATELTIVYTLFDPEGDPVARIYPEFSPNGGGQWFPATPAESGGDGVTNLAASPTGTPHSFVWNIEADLIKSDNVRFRLRVASPARHSPILWPNQASQSLPFRVEAGSFIRVVHADGRPVAGVPVYANGQRLEQTVTGQPVTDQAGLLNPGSLPLSTTLVALALQAEVQTNLGAHQGWAYRTYLTNITVDPAGNTGAFITSGPGEQRLVVRPDQTLILFNIVVSVEWDADEAYLQDVALAMKAAADFLYDVSDGQMTFGEVAIYDNAEQWTEADIQITAKNVVQPHAFIGGLFEAEHAHPIRLGRSWDGNTANQGNWSQPNGYRTLVHEFGHYALGLYDEYFGYELVGGELGGRKEAYCTGPANRDPANDATNVSMMDYHYTSSELADASQWTAWCQETAQHLLNHGEADWQTLLRLYGDSQGRWQLITPDQRTEPDQVVPGPLAAPITILPFPSVTYTNANMGNDPPLFPLQVCANGQPYLDGAWVTLVKGNGQTMDQGLTDELTGQLIILGARPADSLQVVSLDSSLSASKQVALTQADGFLTISGASLQTRSQEPRPYLRLWPTTSNGTLDGLRLVMEQTLPEDSLTYAVTGVDRLGPAAALPYDKGAGRHQVQVSFIPAALAGHTRVQGSHGGSFFELNVDYRLQTARSDHHHELFSNDGNLKLYLESGSFLPDEVQFLVASPWGLPGPLPSGLAIAGEAYEITASSNLTGLERPGVLRLHYDAATSAAVEVDSLAIYRWDFGTNTWQALASQQDIARQEVSAAIDELGLYALLGTAKPTVLASSAQSSAVICGGNGRHIYLPVIAKGS